MCERVAAGCLAVDALFQYGRRLEHYCAAGGYLSCDARLGVAAETLLLFAYRKGPEGRQFHRLASLQAVSNFLQDQFDKG